MPNSRRTGVMIRPVGWAAILVLLATSLPAFSPPVAAAPLTFTVNSTADTGDGTPDGVCDGCTLREAIEEANANPGADTIEFNIPGAGVQTIAPTTALPPITGRVTIDGYTQPGTSVNTKQKGTNAVLLIELSGANAPSTIALDVTSGAATIRGLVINGYSLSSVAVALGADADLSVVEGNFIGTDPTGTSFVGNLGDGVGVFGGGSRVGGSDLADRNLITGNGSAGVRLVSDGNTVENNLIGPGANGQSLGAGNSNSVGLVVSGSQNTVVHNVIAFNNAFGVTVFGPTVGANMRENAIFKNGAEESADQGIDLNNDGITPNDLGPPPDADTGPNNLQNFPVIASVKTTKKTTIKGRLNSTPNSNFTIELFANPKGGKQGQTPLGDVDVTTNADGLATFSFKAKRKIRVGNTITATATDNTTGDTSEFARAKKVK